MVEFTTGMHRHKNSLRYDPLYLRAIKPKNPNDGQESHSFLYVGMLIRAAEAHTEEVSSTGSRAAGL